MRTSILLLTLVFTMGSYSPVYADTVRELIEQDLTELSERIASTPDEEDCQITLKDSDLEISIPSKGLSCNMNLDASGVLVATDGESMSITVPSTVPRRARLISRVSYTDDGIIELICNNTVGKFYMQYVASKEERGC